jgi:hypothetical protein
MIFPEIGEEWVAEFRLLEMLQRVRAVLARPAPDALDVRIGEEYRTNPGEFAGKARESANRNAKAGVEDYPYAAASVKRETQVPAAYRGGDGLDISQTDLVKRSYAKPKAKVGPIGMDW